MRGSRRADRVIVLLRNRRRPCRHGGCHHRGGRFRWLARQVLFHELAHLDFPQRHGDAVDAYFYARPQSLGLEGCTALEACARVP